METIYMMVLGFAFSLSFQGVLSSQLIIYKGRMFAGTRITKQPIATYVNNNTFICREKCARYWGCNAINVMFYTDNSTTCNLFDQPNIAMDMTAQSQSLVILLLPINCTENDTMSSGWSQWGDYSICSVSCGNGVQISERTCLTEATECLLRPCIGDYTRTRSCSATDCYARTTTGTGGWSAWTNGQCSVTCGDGYKTMMRSCNSPSFSDSQCAGSSTSSSPCSEQPCQDPPTAPPEPTPPPPPPAPINGGWSSWKSGGCSSSCGEGIETRTRFCDSPFPKYGGSDCTGDAFKDVPCSTSCSNEPDASYQNAVASCGGSLAVASPEAEAAATDSKAMWIDCKYEYHIDCGCPTSQKPVIYKTSASISYICQDVNAYYTPFCQSQVPTHPFMN